MSFDLSSNQDRIERLADLAERFNFSDGAPAEAATLIPAGLRELAARAHDYQDSARLNLDWWSDTLSEMTAVKYLPSEPDLLQMLGIIGRIFRESDLARGTLATGVRQQYLHFFTEVKLTDELALHADFIRGVMPIYLAREVSAKASNLLKSIEQKTTGWQSTLEESMCKVDLYKKNLEEHAQKYNFMGLSEAFSSVVRVKSVESRIQLSLLILIAIGMVGIPAYNYLHPPEWALVLGSAINLQGLALSHVVVAVVLEFVLVYLFRVVLKSYVSTQNQIVNLRLRSSLCAFVQQYATFAETVRGKNGSDTLGRFEHVVFSHAPTYEGQIPEATDGAAQLLDIFRSIKSK